VKARIILLLLHAAGRLPLSVARRLGRGIGRVLWWLHTSPRRVTERNILLAFPELDAPARRHLAYRSLLATGELAVEMGSIWTRPWEDVRRRILEVRGEHAVRAALAEGRGVVVLGPHLGNWEVVGLYLSTLGDALALYKPPQMKALEDVMRVARERSGTRLVPTTGRGLATLVRTLRGGGVTGILPDQLPDAAEAGENSVFMGIPVFTMSFASKLLQRSGAAAFFAFAERVSGGFRLHFLPAEASIYSADLQQSLTALNRGVEACLRHCPEQYQWEYKRFRTSPRGPVDVYSPEWQPGVGAMGRAP